MTKYMYIYHGGGSKADMANTSEEQMKEVMGAWMAWYESKGEAVVDAGSPFGSDGVSGDEGEEKGFSIVQAESMEAAVEMTHDHPHVTMAGGTIRVYEMLELSM